MADFMFPDNTVLINFACVERLELLQAVLDSRGRWTEGVEFEVRRSSAFYPALSSVREDGWLGEPIVVSESADQIAVEYLRTTVLGGPISEATKNLGEAQSLHVLATQPGFADSVWISDDRDSLRLARNRLIPVMETMHVVRDAMELGKLTPAGAIALLQQMRAEGRTNVRLPRGVADWN